MCPRCPGTNQDAHGQAELPLMPSGSWTVPAVGGGALALRNAGGVLSPQVTCRALGIGAYLVRLGQRVIPPPAASGGEVSYYSGHVRLNRLTFLGGARQFWPPPPPLPLPRT